MNPEIKERFELLLSPLKNDFSNKNLHNLIIDFSIENDTEMDLINFYKSNMEKYPDICNEMLETLANRSVARLYKNKIQKQSIEEGKRTAIKITIILIATIVALVFIWRGLLSAFKVQFFP